MLKVIELENFKAFGERTRIPLAPITLIFGENSAGKSSILQSLSLLKQTWETAEPGAVLLPRTDRGLVDLGSFSELLFDHDLGRSLTMRFGFDSSSPESDIARRETDLEFELQFKCPSPERPIQLDHLSIAQAGSQEEIARFSPVSESESLRNRVRLGLLSAMHAARHGYFDVYEIAESTNRVRCRGYAKCTSVTQNPEYWRPYFEQALKNRRKLAQDLGRLLKATRRHEPTGGARAAAREATQWERVSEAKRFYAADFTLKEFIRRMRKCQLGEQVVTEVFVPRRLPVPEAVESRLPEVTAARHLGIPSDLSVVSPLCGQGWLLETALKSLFPMGPFRRPPERSYTYTGPKPADVGYSGERLPDLLYKNEDLCREANDWLNKLGIGHQISARTIQGGLGDQFVVRLTDTRRGGKVEVGFPDVGSGTSQLLPFVVQALAPGGRTITIEEPEGHVHPKLQADLGDLLAEAILPPRNNRFLIETHSEHLVLRMQRLVREKRLLPEQISIIYVSRGPHGAHAQQLRLGESGDFLDEWPDGFFPERLREIL